jgi:hypothetical protein
MIATSRKFVFWALIIALPGSTQMAGAQRINSIKPSAPVTTVTLDGVVRDREGRPLAAAEIIVDDSHRTITNSRGEFSIPDLQAGLIEFTARRIGYTPVTTGVQVEPGLTVHLAVKLVPVAVQLGTMVIEGKAIDKSLWQTGFYKRRDANSGHFFDPEQVSHFHAGVSSLISTVPALYLSRNRNMSIPMGKLPDGNSCFMNVFVDGNRYPWVSTSGIDDVANMEDVLAVEVYPRAAEMPSRIAGIGGVSGTGNIGTVTLQSGSFQMGSTSGECGAILIWTRPLKSKSK